MKKLDFTKCETVEQYYLKLANYWEKIATACLHDLETFEYVRRNDDGAWYYTNTGDLVDGEW